jgi:hypothetical protein
MSDADRAALDEWAAGEPAGWRELSQLRSFVRAPVVYPPMASGEELWQRVAERVGRGRRRRVLTRWVPLVGSLAAALVVASVVVNRGRVVAVQVQVGLPLSAIPDSDVPAPVGEVDRVGRPEPASSASSASSELSASSATVRPIEMAENDADVARSPYAGTPLDYADRANQAMRLTDDVPGAADTPWP